MIIWDYFSYSTFPLDFVETRLFFFLAPKQLSKLLCDGIKRSRHSATSCQNLSLSISIYFVHVDSSRYQKSYALTRHGNSSDNTKTSYRWMQIISILKLHENWTYVFLWHRSYAFYFCYFKEFTWRQINPELLHRA